MIWFVGALLVCAWASLLVRGAAQFQRDVRVEAERDPDPEHLEPEPPRMDIPAAMEAYARWNISVGIHPGTEVMTRVDLPERPN
jgi:hypothetical protein